MTSSISSPLILAPGPVTVSETVLNAVARPMIFHRSPEFHELYSRCLRNTALAFGQSEHKVVILPGSGSEAIESCLLTLHPRNEPLLIVSNGLFGDRIIGMAKRAGLDVDVLAVEWGEPITAEGVRAMLRKRRATSLFLVALETSTGCVNQVAELGGVCREFGVTFYVDAVSAYFAESLDLTDAAVDVCITVPNKALEGLPGVALVSVRKDLLACANANVPHSMDVREAVRAADELETVFTPPSSVLFALDAAFGQLRDETAQARRARYAARSERLREGFAALGLSRIAQRVDAEARAITTLGMERNKAILIQRILRAGGYQVFMRSYDQRFGGRALVQFSVMGEVTAADADAVVALTRRAVADA